MAEKERETGEVKAERTQLSDDRLERWLRGMPGWEPAGRARAIRRTYELPSSRAAVSFVAYTAEIAHTLGRGPDVELRGSRVTLTLPARGTGPLSADDLALAEAIDRKG